MGPCTRLFAPGAYRPAGPGCPLPLGGSRRISVPSELYPKAGKRQSPAQRGVKWLAGFSLALPGARHLSAVHGVP